MSDCISYDTLQRSVLRSLTLNNFLCVLKERRVSVMKFAVKLENCVELEGFLL